MRSWLIGVCLVALGAAAFAACSDPQATPAGSKLRTCAADIECGAHQYCTNAHLCRSDCFADLDCWGPDRDSQCNVHGRCISPRGPGPFDDAAPPADVGSGQDALDPVVDGDLDAPRGDDGGAFEGGP